MKHFNLLVLLILGFLSVSFSYLNPGMVTINYYLDSIDLSLTVAMLLALLLGLLIGILYAAFIYIRLKRVSYRLKSDLKIANKEIENLRNMPIRDRH